MSKYFVRIDRSTVEKKEHEPPKPILQGMDVDFTLNELPDKILKDPRIYNVNHEFSTDEGEKFHVKANCKSVIEDYGITNASVRYHYLEIKGPFGRPLMGHSYWCFDYHNIEVQCEECGEKFMDNELQSDETMDGDYSETICPKCGEFECCDIEYEDLTDEMKLHK